MTQDDEPKTGQDETEERDEAGIFLPPLDLTSLILPFYTQALIKMGLIEDPGGAPTEVNLDLAKRLIDLLDLFRTKTSGNLAADEEKFLESMLHQLKMHYMDKAKLLNF